MGIPLWHLQFATSWHASACPFRTKFVGRSIAWMCTSRSPRLETTATRGSRSNGRCKIQKANTKAPSSKASSFPMVSSMDPGEMTLLTPPAPRRKAYFGCYPDRPYLISLHDWDAAIRLGRRNLRFCRRCVATPEQRGCGRSFHPAPFGPAPSKQTSDCRPRVSEFVTGKPSQSILAQKPGIDNGLADRVAVAHERRLEQPALRATWRHVCKLGNIKQTGDHRRLRCKRKCVVAVGPFDRAADRQEDAT